MKPKTQRLALVILGGLSIAGALGVVMWTLEENIVYFYTPTDILSKSIPQNQRMRVGGYVVKDSITPSPDQTQIYFQITDHKNVLRVSFRGTPPNLFAEEQGVVAEGVFNTQKVLVADRILAKHDENYRPPEANS